MLGKSIKAAAIGLPVLAGSAAGAEAMPAVSFAGGDATVQRVQFLPPGLMEFFGQMAAPRRIYRRPPPPPCPPAFLKPDPAGSPMFVCDWGHPRNPPVYPDRLPSPPDSAYPKPGYPPQGMPRQTTPYDGGPVEPPSPPPGASIPQPGQPEVVQVPRRNPAQAEAPIRPQPDALSPIRPANLDSVQTFADDNRRAVARSCLGHHWTSSKCLAAGAEAAANLGSSYGAALAAKDPSDAALVRSACTMRAHFPTDEKSRAVFFNACAEAVGAALATSHIPVNGKLMAAVNAAKVCYGDQYDACDSLERQLAPYAR